MVSMRYYGVLALVFVAPAAAMRVVLEKRTKATIAGVPVLNYHLAYQGKSYRHAIHRSSASLASLASLEIDPKEEDWVIVLNTDIAEEKIHEACRKGTATCSIEGHASGRGFPFIALHGTEAELEQVLLATGGARFVEVDIPIRMIPEIQDINMETANSHNGEASKMANGGVAKSDTWWHLQKIGAPLRAHTGKGVHVFVLDTGVLTTHLDFEGRAKPFAETVGDGWGGSKGLCQKFHEGPPEPCAADWRGHGTHCAGTVGGATLGVAPGASLYAVKVLDDTGRGPTSAIVSGMDLAASSGHRPAVLSMSLGYTGIDRALLEAVTMVVSQGLTVVVAAGNNFGDACDGALARSPDAITVGATTSDNARASFSNFGTCVDIFAPGRDIRSASVDRAHVDEWDVDEQDLSATTSLSGTSMACPAVAGAAALLLEATPKLTPEEVRKNLLANAGSNYINNLSPMDTTNNKLLYVGSDAPQTALSKPPADTKPWPTPDYWSACQGQFALGPVDLLPNGSDFAEHHCQCVHPATCSTPHGGACPLSKAFQLIVDEHDVAEQVTGVFFVWTCTDCACQNSGQNSGSFATTLHWIAAVIALHVVAVVGA